MSTVASRRVEIRPGLESHYADVFTPQVLSALDALAAFDGDRKAVMSARIARRDARARNRERLKFLDPAATIARTTITVQEARDGAFTGITIPADLQRQWIQGTGPGAKPRATVDQSTRNVAPALL